MPNFANPKPLTCGILAALSLSGGQPVSIGLMATWYAEAPASTPDWGVRFVFTFLFPKS